MGSIAGVIDEPAQARWLRLLWKLSGRRPSVDAFLTGLLKYRRCLPECDAQEIIPNFSETEVRIKQCPMGAWSTPLVDVFVVLKAAIGFRSKRILELGSYRGDTARLLAENTGPDALITTVDVDERHGAAYRDLPIASKIRRRTGKISKTLFDQGEKFDLIFVDADHDFRSVMNDTEVAFEVLAPEGVILWHDYNFEKYFHGLCGVPEALGHFARGRPMYGIRGTWVAIYSNVGGWQTGQIPDKRKKAGGGSVWEQEQVRG
jgi:SAM-dependent methyltransferase